MSDDGYLIMPRESLQTAPWPVRDTFAVYHWQTGDNQFEIVPAAHGRSWMNETYQRSAYRCLPVLMANQSGWLILNNADVKFRWSGEAHINAIEIQGDGYPLTDGAPGVISHFGCGIVSWTLPFLVRTPDGYNTLVRGPANVCKDAVAPLEGVVETDWAVATFTMNWKITRPDTWIEFGKGEPFCMLVPQKRGELERFEPKLSLLSSNPQLAKACVAWQQIRGSFNAALKDGCPLASREQWQKDYFKGSTPDGQNTSEHQTKLRLRTFNGQ